jgi:hypothetical protein
MVKHLVLVKFKEGITDDDPRVKEVMERFERMPQEIPVIKGWQTGLNFAARPFGSEWALCSDFEDETAFDAYLRHPAHIEAVNLWREIATWTYCDFNY